jgi:type I site-specific restriction-modification system R (restriction) subunit
VTVFGDYLGIASDLKKALSFYSDAGGKGDPTILQEQAVAFMMEKLGEDSQPFLGFSHVNFFSAETTQKLTRSSKNSSDKKERSGFLIPEASKTSITCSETKA